jgi:putative flippase GtrA
MARRRRRAGPGERLLIQAITVWFLWYVLSHVPHVTSTAAALIAGAVWGLLAGWRFRGRIERSMRRLVRRAFWRFGVRVSFPGRRRR